MRSIKIELTLIITLIVASTTFGIVVSSLLFLDDFYVYKKTNMLNDNMKIIDTQYNGNYNSIKKNLTNLENEYGLIFYINSDKKNADDGIKFQHILKDGTTITTYLYKKNIMKTMGTVLPFIIIVGFIFTILSIFLSMFFSKRLTKPILDINNIANEISNLNFNVKYKGKIKNEIGSLGNSINNVSMQLEDKINTLENDNQKLYHDINAKEQTELLRKKLISDISHELRTPVTAIKGYSEYLSQVDDEKRRNKYISIIYDESTKLSNLIDEILDMSKMQNNEMTFLTEKIYLPDEIDSIISIYNNKFETENIDFLKEIDPIYIHFDRLKLSQIIRNFINNALFFVDETKKIKIYTQTKGAKYYLCVFNSGQQIDAIYKDVIWDSFFKIDKSRAYGNGIGLSIVKEIMDKINLSYGFENKTNGIVFYIELIL